jgi:hypothetical protein
MHVDMRTYLCIAMRRTSDILEHGAVSETDHMLPVVPFCGALREDPRLSASFAHWTGQASGAGSIHMQMYPSSVLGCYILLTGIEALSSQLWHTDALDLGRRVCGEGDSGFVD